MSWLVVRVRKSWLNMTLLWLLYIVPWWMMVWFHTAHDLNCQANSISIYFNVIHNFTRGRCINYIHLQINYFCCNNLVLAWTFWVANHPGKLLLITNIDDYVTKVTITLMNLGCEFCEYHWPQYHLFACLCTNIEEMISVSYVVKFLFDVLPAVLKSP